MDLLDPRVDFVFKRIFGSENKTRGASYLRMLPFYYYIIRSIHIRTNCIRQEVSLLWVGYPFPKSLVRSFIEAGIEDGE